jgi:Domain of unknown function (DUF4276)
LYAIIAEDKSDVETLTALIRLIAGSQSIPIKGKGYGGCAEMLRKGARQIRAFHDAGSCQRFVICYDSDRASPDARHKELIDKVIVPSNVNAPMCALIPIQEIEAWILADVKAVTKIITGWVPDKNIGNPEDIVDPKEYLEKMSRQNQRPRYSHAVHNAKIARHLDVELVHNKCPSFRPLYEMVKTGKGNV